MYTDLETIRQDLLYKQIINYIDITWQYNIFCIMQVYVIILLVQNNVFKLLKYNVLTTVK